MYFTSALSGRVCYDLLSRGFALLHLWLPALAPFGANEKKDQLPGSRESAMDDRSDCAEDNETLK